MSLFDAVFATLLEWIADRMSRVQVRVDYGLPSDPQAVSQLRVLVTVTNRSRRPVTVTRIWLATEPPVEIRGGNNLPDIISPTGVFAVGVSALAVPQLGSVGRAGRVELADGRIIKSR